MKPKWDPDDVTIPAEGDLISDETAIPVDAIRAYSVGQLPLPVELTRIRALPEDDHGRRVRVSQVKVDGQWVDL